MYDIDKMHRNNFKDVYNDAFIVGDIVGIEERGIHAGVEQLLVLVRTHRKGSKSHFVLVMLPDCSETLDLIDKKSRIIIQGKLDVSFTFNFENSKYVFINPSKITEVNRDFKMKELKEFYLNYTLYNRVILEGQIIGEPTRKFIKSSGVYLNKFKLKLKGMDGKNKTVNCTLWETVKDMVELRDGLNIKVVSSLSTNNSKIVGMEKNTPKVEGTVNYNYYNLIVQKIYDLDNIPEKIAQKIYNI